MHRDPGRTWHYRDFYQPAGTPSPEANPLWLTWGNCQAEALRRLLDAVPGRPYRTARIPPVHELQRSDLPYVAAILKHTAVLLTQPVRANYRDLPIGVADVRRLLSPAATVLRWPVIRYAGLYPFQVIARDPRDRSITPAGVPYHDLRTVAAARAGLVPTDPWDVDVSAEQIRAVAESSRAELALRERRDTDVGVSDVLQRHGAEAAHTINHPGNPVLHDLAARILGVLGVASTPDAALDPLLGSAWAPLERRVLDALGIVAPARPLWRLDGVDLHPDDVHATQLMWYRTHPEFIELTERRHGATMCALGLLGGRR